MCLEKIKCERKYYLPPTTSQMDDFGLPNTNENEEITRYIQKEQNEMRKET